LSGNKVYLRIDMDFTNKTDKATFYYSTDSTTWKALGNTLQMSYELTHFTGYRFGLFAYSTKASGGTADFDWFKIGSSYTSGTELYPVSLDRQEKSAPGKLLTYRWDRGASELRLRYSLEASGNVGFRLYDTRGRLVSRVAERFVGTGDQFIGLPTSGLRDGAYFLVGKRDGVTWGSWPISISQ